jgi:hypothetical protein
MNIPRRYTCYVCQKKYQMSKLRKQLIDEGHLVPVYIKEGMCPSCWHELESVMGRPPELKNEK